jgi:uncharacterized protein YciI
MFFHLYLNFDVSAAVAQEQLRAEAETYWADNAAHLILRGAIISDDKVAEIALVAFMEFDHLAAAERFIAGDPWNKATVYKETQITRWTNGLKRTPETLPYKFGESYWHLRGFGKPNIHAQRQEIFQDHIGYYNPYDAKKILIRGALLKANIDEWQGSAIVVEMGSREEIKTFLADEPYFMNGLYDRILIERFQVQYTPSP